MLELVGLKKAKAYTAWKGTSIQMFAYTKSTRFLSGHLATQRCRNFEIVGEVLYSKQVIKKYM